MTTDQVGHNTLHDAALSRLKTKKKQILYALEHMPRGSTVEDVRGWLGDHGQPVPSRPYAAPIVNEWRARNGVTDTSGHVPLTPELIAKLDEAEGGAAANGVAANGATTNNATTNVAAANGATANNAAANGATTNGTTANGTTTNNATANGTAANNATANNATANAATANGAAANNATASAERPAEPPKPAGAKGFYAVALLSIGVSVDTSWRFFEQRLGITDTWERAILFSVVEAALIACGWAMRAGVRREGRPGPARLVAWALTAFAAFAALALSGPVAGTARVLLGPVLGLVMLHLALGIEIRAARQHTTTWARVGRELRERLLSLLGLGDDHRDALARTRDRAALRAAKLALASRWTPWRTSRLRKALHVSNVAHDPAQRDRMLRELAVLQHARSLAETTRPAPW